MSGDSMLCEKCGTEIKEGDAFCSKCGTKLDSPAEVIPPEAKSKKSFFSKTQMSVIIGLLFVCTVGICLYAFYLNGVFDPSEQSVIAKINFEDHFDRTKYDDRKVDFYEQAASRRVSHLDPPVYSKSDAYKEFYTPWDVNNNKNCQFICVNFGSEFNSCYAPDGCNYYFVKVFIENNDDTPISTNPIFWKLAVDGVTYSNDKATYSFNDPLRLISHGGKATFDLVYIVQGHPDAVKLFYMG